MDFICFDGSADRCKYPVALTIIANPKPLKLKVDDRESMLSLYTNIIIYTNDMRTIQKIHYV